MSTTDDQAGLLGDARLRALHKLAEKVDGDELERVKEAIDRRRRELQQAEHEPRSLLGPKRSWRPPPD